MSLAVFAAKQVGRVVNFGRAYWSDPWDVLVVLDACRYDLFSEIAPEYDWLPDEVDCRYSPASQSREFLLKHVRSEYADEVARTAIVSGNPYTDDDRIAGAGWAALRHIWDDGWDDEVGTVPPEAVTEAALPVDAGDRLIVWYMQPHMPFIPARLNGEDDRLEGRDVWTHLEHGRLSRKTVWDAYADNLRLVLDELPELLDKLDGHVVITSDHGNALGEWGMYGHPSGVPIPILKRVPWIEIGRDEKRGWT